MGSRLQRSIKVVLDIRINLCKRWALLSVGGRGAHVTRRSDHKAGVTVGLPGSVLSFTEGGGASRPGMPEPPSGIRGRRGLFAAVALMAVFEFMMYHSQ